MGRQYGICGWRLGLEKVRPPVRKAFRLYAMECFTARLTRPAQQARCGRWKVRFAMIVPQYWAEVRLQERVGSRQITVRRHGWSDASPDEARKMSEARAREAIGRIKDGEKLPRREPKRAYNGAEGVPIREEIVARYGDAVVTRNSYGALCLNVPDVLFADVDFEDRPGAGYGCPAVFLPALCASVAAGVYWESFWAAVPSGIAAALAAPIAVSVLKRVAALAAGGQERIARRRIESFLASHGDWHLRIYRTPAGLRLMAMHRTFDPGDPEVSEFFEALGTDPVYARMCLRQKCFRARVSPKPWRIGVAEHVYPRGVWPVSPDMLPMRQRWIENYEAATRDYAACRYVEDAGSGSVNAKARAVQAVHDEMCRAMSGLPIA